MFSSCQTQEEQIKTGKVETYMTSMIFLMLICICQQTNGSCEVFRQKVVDKNEKGIALISNVLEANTSTNTQTY